MTTSDDGLYLIICMCIHQKSLGVPSQVQGVMTAPTMSTHSQVLSAGMRVLVICAIKMMNTVVPPN